MRLKPVVALLLHIFDVLSDIYVAVQYWRNGQFVWFWLTFVFIVYPLLLVNYISFLYHRNACTCIFGRLQFSMIPRYIYAIFSDSHDFIIAKLQYMETIGESAPQWCIQTYIMLRLWEFPWYTILLVLISLVSLACSITTLEREKAKNENQEFGFLNTVLFLMWQLSTLVSRLFAIVICGYTFAIYLCFWFLVHWFVMAVMGLCLTCCANWLLALVVVIPSCYHSSEAFFPIKNRRALMVIGYVLLLIENIIMLTLNQIVDNRYGYLGVLNPVSTSCIVGGSVLSIIFMFLHYKYYCPRQLEIP